VHWTGILTTEGITSMPHHIQDSDNAVCSQPGHVTLDNQSGSLSTRSDASRFESVDSDKE